MVKVERVKYYTENKFDLISAENLILYEHYLTSNMVRNTDTFNTTYYVYQQNFNYFMVFLAERYNNIGLYSEEFMQYGPDIVEAYMAFCKKILLNNKKTINNKVSAILSFYKWSSKKRMIPYNPLADKVDFVSKANEERIIQDYFLTQEQIDEISFHLAEQPDEKFDYQDVLLWFIFLDSANRVGAIEQLSISKIDYDKNSFRNVIEKEARAVDVAVSEQTMNLIKYWIEQRKTGYDLLSEDALFIVKYGGRWKRMTRRTIQKRIQKIGTIIGIEDLHPHSIRKSAASNMLERGADSFLISRYLNHKSMEVLKHYIKPQNASDLRKQIEEQIK